MMDERVQFVACRLAGEPMADLRREFGISRKTGYKIFGRYQECEVQGCTSLASMDAFLFLQRTERRTHLPTPKLNAHVERSHRTHHEEFYQVHADSDQPPRLNHQLRRWEHTYNCVRPHQSLAYLTPLEFVTRWKLHRRKAKCH